MEDLKCLVKKLEQTSNEKEQIRLLQAIGDKLLTEYVIVIPTLNVTIEPLRVEAYYYPYNNFSNKWIYMKHIKAIGGKFKKSMFCTE